MGDDERNAHNRNIISKKQNGEMKSMQKERYQTRQQNIKKHKK